MIKEIKYNGLTSLPSDYESPDGDLALSLDLLDDGGGLHTLHAPALLSTFPPGWTPLCIHDAPLGRRLILHTPTGIQALSLPENFPDTPLPEFHEINDFRPPYTLDTVNFQPSLPTCPPATLGNFLIISYPRSLERHLLTAEGYSSLGDTLPTPGIEFSLFADPDKDPSLESLRQFDLTITIPKDTPADIRSHIRTYWPSPDGETFTPEGEAGEKAWKKILSDLTARLFARINTLHASARRASMFTTPFFIRYALRLTDGSHVAHSAPVLMTPCSHTVAGFHTSGPDAPSISEKDGDITLTFPVLLSPTPVTLAFRLYDMGRLDNSWKDLITHIDIFITPPIYSFDADTTLTEGPAPLSSGPVTHYATRATGIIRPGDDSWPSSANFPPPGTATILYPQDNYESHYSYPAHFPLPAATTLDERIPAAATFRLIASLPADQCREMPHPAILPIPFGALESIHARPTLADDPFSLHLARIHI